MAGIDPVSDATGSAAQPTAAPVPGARGATKDRAEPGRRSLLRELPILVIVALVIAMVIKSFVVQAFVIPTGSMQNTLALKDKILVNKLVYHLRAIHPGDIVVFDGSGSWDAAAPPSTTSSDPAVRLYDDTVRKLFDSVGGLFGTPIGQTDYVKRVIGVPGDHVVCCNAQGLITINGVPLHEQSYLYPGDRPGSAPSGIPGHFNVTVPAGYLWVLGDHRGISDDSRGHEADPGNGMIPERRRSSGARFSSPGRRASGRSCRSRQPLSSRASSGLAVTRSGRRRYSGALRRRQRGQASRRDAAVGRCPARGPVLAGGRGFHGHVPGLVVLQEDREPPRTCPWPPVIGLGVAGPAKSAGGADPAAAIGSGR